MRPTKPETKKVDIMERVWDTNVADPYRWLEEDSADVAAWVARQNAFTRSLIDHVDARRNITARLEKLFYTDTFGIPVPKGNRYFFTERKSNEDLRALYVQDDLHAVPRILLNPNTLSPDKTVVLQGWYPSDDGSLVVYALSHAANDQASLHLMDVTTGKNLPDTISAETYPNLYSSICWASDNSGFWYTRRKPGAPQKGEEKFHRRLYFHRIGEDFQKDEMVFGSTIHKEDYLWADTSDDGRYLLVTVYVTAGGQDRTELYVKDLTRLSTDFIPIIQNTDAQFYGIIHRGAVHILTNHNAPLWRIMSQGMENVMVGKAEWKDTVPESSYTIEHFTVIKDKIFVAALHNVCSVLKVYDLNGRFVTDISLPVLGTAGVPMGEPNGEEGFFGFSSFSYPFTVFRIDVNTNTVIMVKQEKTDIDTDAFAVDQQWYISKDGTKVPMFLVYRKGMKKSGDNPLLLYAYGGFGINETPGFSKFIIPFLESGGIYAVANIRGGGEFGEQWHLAAVKEKRQVAFDDFIAAAEWLVDNKHTNKDKLALAGWSNGGLLVSTVMTQRPDLCAAVVIGVPVTDMVRYHLFFGGKHWVRDYGCAENRDDFRYLFAYSPYHNVRSGTNYPAALILTSDKDDRVHPAHAYKITAKLQEVSGSETPVLLRVDIKSGHSGAAAVSKLVEQEADILSFLYWRLRVRG